MGQTYSHKIFLSFFGFFHLGFIFGFLIFNYESLKQRINRLMYEYNKVVNPIKFTIKDENSEGNASVASADNATPMINNSRSYTFTSESECEDNSPNYYKKFKMEYYPMAFLKKLIMRKN